MCSNSKCIQVQWTMNRLKAQYTQGMRGTASAFTGTGACHGSAAALCPTGGMFPMPRKMHSLFLDV